MHAPQIQKISKVYPALYLNKIQNLLRVDSTSDAIELKEIYEDSFGIAEAYLNKDITYTLNEYTFKEFSGKELIVDEGNYSSISAITSTDVYNNSTVITDYTVWYDSNNFKITFANCINNAKELKVRFYSGFSGDTMPKPIRRAIYIIINDLYDFERSSYSVSQSKKSDAIERLLNPLKKTFFKSYDANPYNHFINS